MIEAAYRFARAPPAMGVRSARMARGVAVETPAIRLPIANQQSPIGMSFFSGFRSDIVPKSSSEYCLTN